MTRRKLLEEDLIRRQIQEALRVGPHHLYVLGRLDLQVNVYSQQVRAINLLHGVAESEDLKLESARVAVVGGGVAGLTAAATAAWLGFRDVTLFEKGTEVLNTFNHNRVRFLHPHMYEWPEATWSQPRAGVPILDWKANSPEGVAQEISESWRALRDAFDIKRSSYEESEVTKVEQSADPKSADPLRLWFSTGREKTFDVVILAVGFGPERDLQGGPGYWHNDNYEVSQEDSERPTYVVSGCGDGGLIDYLRMRLRDFSQGDLIQRFLPDGDPEVENAKKALIDIERELWEVKLPQEDQAEKAGDANHQLETQRWLFGKYWAIPVTEIGKKIKQSLRPGTFAFLESDEESPLRPAAFILNRFLALQVLRADGLEVDDSTGLPLATVNGKIHRWPHHSPPDRSPVPRITKTINRHGPSSSLAKQFPEIHEVVGRQRLPRHNDATRRPGWRTGKDWEEASLRWDLTHAVLGAEDLIDLIARLLRFCNDNRNRWRTEQGHVFGASKSFIGTRTILVEFFEELSDRPNAQEKRNLIQLLGRLWERFGSALAVAHLATTAFQEALRGRLLMLFRDRIEPAGPTGLTMESGSLVPAHPPRGVLEALDSAGMPQLTSVALLPAENNFEVRFVWHSDIPAGKSLNEVGVAIPNTDNRHLHIDRTPLGWTARLLRSQDQLEVLLKLLAGLNAATVALAMPELSSDPVVLQGLEAWLRASGRSIVIAAGTYHTHGVPNSHQATLLAASTSGVTSYSYSKSTPCEVEELSLEGIPRDKPRLTVHFSSTSSLVSVVCADLKRPEVRELLNALRPRLILVPACPGSRLNDEAHGLAKSLGSIVAVAYAPLLTNPVEPTAAYVAGCPMGTVEEQNRGFQRAPEVFVP